MSARAGAAALVAVLLAGSGCKGGAVTPFRLGKDADSLASLAADGALVARAAADGETTAAFTLVRSQELAAKSGQLASVVASAHPEPGLAVKTGRLVGLARLVSRRLRELADRPGSKAVASRVFSALSAAGDAASRIGKSA